MLSARSDADGFALTVAAPHRAIPALLDHLESTERHLARLTTRQVSLEDVFVSLTGRHLREDEQAETPRPTGRGKPQRTRVGPFQDGRFPPLVAIRSSLTHHRGTNRSDHPILEAPLVMAHYRPLRSLYLTRLREFYRQPARLFWVYGFPTVLALGLGLAFRSPAVPTIQGDLVEGPQPRRHDGRRRPECRARRSPTRSSS